MNKKNILALLSGTLLLASIVWGETKKEQKNQDANLEKAEVPQEIIEKHHKNPFMEQDDTRKSLFTDDKNFFINTSDIFGASDVDPWDD